VIGHRVRKSTWIATIALPVRAEAQEQTPMLTKVATVIVVGSDQRATIALCAGVTDISGGLASRSI
jgi:hypothetical protein